MGLGALGPVSYRTLLATLADDLIINPVTSVSMVMDRWIALFSAAYKAFDLVQRCTILHAKVPHDPNANPALPNQRTKGRRNRVWQPKNWMASDSASLDTYLPSRKPEAAHVFFGPAGCQFPHSPTVDNQEISRWWGVPNIIDRSNTRRR